MMSKELSGILLIDKPEGVTSHDVVDCVRKRGRFRKVGHTGTLDPFATGLLVLLIGEMTRRSTTFLHDEKSYEATMLLGVSTETGDCEGKPVCFGPYHHVTREKMVEVFGSLRGPQEQIPPMYSAIKHRGEKLYELARKGLSVERAPRSIFIRTLELRDFNPPSISFSLSCSKGTYVRTLSETIGERLGCPAHLSSLRRVRAGAFSIDEAIPYGEIRCLERDSLMPYLKNFSGLL